MRRVGCYDAIMPSWNVHTAHVQRLLREGSPSALGIRDVNAFLFGNYVPDIYVGYMVPKPSGILPYRLTHLAGSGHGPIPREREFWDTYVVPTRAVPDGAPFVPAHVSVEQCVEITRAGGHVERAATPERHAALVKCLSAPGYRASDVTLGAWAHLLCDGAYNMATRAWLQSHNVRASEETRIRKQDDFLQFGRTLPVSLKCHIDEALLSQAAAFPHYAIGEPDVRAAVHSADEIVDDNLRHHADATPDYQLLRAEFFHEVFEHVTERLLERLSAYAKKID